jgi:predicted ATPase
MEGPPLQRWELSGFRSVRDELAVDLKPINILVGANSAGKSSVIQSILLAAQTLNSNWAPRALVLNGSLVQLGLPDDCLNEQAKGSFSFGFTYCARNDPEFPRRRVRVPGTTSVSSTFGVQRGSLELERSQIVAIPDDDSPAPTGQRLTYERRSQREMEKAFRQVGLRGQRVKGALNSGIVPVSASGSTLSSVHAARFRQFLPQALFATENRTNAALLRVLRVAEQQAEQAQLQRAISRSRSQLAQASARPLFRVREERIPPRVVKFVTTYLRHEGITVPSNAKGDLSLDELLRMLPSEAWDPLSKLLDSEWIEDNIEHLTPDIDLERAESDEPFDALILAARQFFARSVRHLGPLREEPKPLYGLSEAASGDSVGSSGEYTAALLDAYGQRIVDCPQLDGGTTRIPLGRAVDYWLESIGLLSSVDVHERGKLGYEINLHIEGVKKSLDLTAVGVGVSQALPVIVQGLVAPPGTLVMFEQPELHLHPDVQAAIADFFLALSRSGRQIILETHSEYLVNRIRLRAVEDRQDEIPDLVSLLFVERSAGTTTLQPVEITSYGGLKNWPTGFLDQAGREAEAIMAAVEKKAAEEGD